LPIDMRAAEEIVSDIEPEPYIDVPTVCRRLGVNRKWLYRVIREAGFPSYKMPGGQHRFKQSEIEKWMLEHRATHRPRSEEQ
jgi:excisionase family DNA binding protein